MPRVDISITIAVVVALSGMRMFGQARHYGRRQALSIEADIPDLF
jgi:hypothetical protein